MCHSPPGRALGHRARQQQRRRRRRRRVVVVGIVVVVVVVVVVVERQRRDALRRESLPGRDDGLCLSRRGCGRADQRRRAARVRRPHVRAQQGAQQREQLRRRRVGRCRRLRRLVSLLLRFSMNPSPSLPRTTSLPRPPPATAVGGRLVRQRRDDCRRGASPPSPDLTPRRPICHKRHNDESPVARSDPPTPNLS